MTASTAYLMDLGVVMKGLRERAGKTPGAAGAHLELSRKVILNLESGRNTKLTTIQIESLLDLYDPPAAERERTLRLWAEIRQQSNARKASKGHWIEYADQIASNFPKFLQLEEVTRRILTYHPVIVPGLLQQPDYRRAIIRIDEPDVSAVDMERRAELTRKRQVRLDDPELEVVVLLSEAVMRNIVGGPAVMAAQLEWMTELAERGNISIRLIPFDVAPHRGLTIQSFTQMEFAPGESGLTRPPVVYVEGAFSMSYHERTDIVAEYQRAIKELRAVALSESDTVDVLVRMIKEYAA